MEFLTRSTVDFGDNIFKEQIGNGVEVSSFRDILPNEFVVVFNAAFFPRGIRVGEEDLRPEFLCNGFMSGELAAVVGGNGSDLTDIRE